MDEANKMFQKRGVAVIDDEMARLISRREAFPIEWVSDKDTDKQPSFFILRSVFWSIRHKPNCSERSELFIELNCMVDKETKHLKDIV